MMMKKNEKLEVRDVAVDAIESTELVEAPEKKQPKKIWLLLAALGPGIVTAMAGNDAGGISTTISSTHMMGMTHSVAKPNFAPTVE